MEFCQKAQANAFGDWKVPEKLKSEYCYLELRDAFRYLSCLVESQGQEALADNIAVLAKICEMVLSLSDAATPFRALETLQNCSSTDSLDDFVDVHFEVLESALSLTSNFAILARILDVIWTRKQPSNRNYAIGAIKNYVALAAEIRINQTDKLVYASKYLERSIQLWKLIRSDPQIRKSIEDEIEMSLMSSNSDSSSFIHYYYFKLLPSIAQHSGLEKWKVIGEKFVDESIKQKNFEKARGYIATIRLLYKNGKDLSNAELFRGMQTDLFVDEAREMRHAGGEPVALQYFFSKAIAECRNTKGKNSISKELHKELLEIQKLIPGQLKGYPMNFDLSSEIDYLFEVLDKQNFGSVFKIIAREVSPASKMKLFSEAECQLEEFSIQSGKRSMVDEKGKIIAKRSGRGATLQELAAAVRSRASQNLLVTFRKKGFVLLRAQLQIVNRSDFDESLIDSLVCTSSFVPASRREQIKRGILTGLQGDWISCVSILTPQLENSLRHIMQNAGHNMACIDHFGIQKEKDLNDFIETEEFRNLVGEDMQFQLQVLLCDRAGLNLRNNVAHGLLTDNAALSGTSAFLWALTILLCDNFQEGSNAVPASLHNTDDPN